MTRARASRIAIAVVTLLAAAGCSDSPAEPSAGSDSDPVGFVHFVAAVTNPFFPLAPGTTARYQGREEGEEVTSTVEVLGETRMVMGVVATVVRERVYLDGALSEESFEWYAQDADGNVWHLGEDSRRIENGQVVGREGSWEAGVGGARPGIIMWGDPAARVGESYRQEYSAGEGEDWGRVVAVGQSVEVPYGRFTGCVQTEDWDALEAGAVENKFYCPGTGPTLELLVQGGSERLELVDVAVRAVEVAPAVVLAVGDIASCRSEGDEATSRLVDSLPGVVLTLGDHAYMRGSSAEYRDCYEPSWGRHRGRTRPTPGNHDYGSPGASPYFDYFGVAAGPPGRGYYSFELAGWHVVSLNSNVDMRAGSAQERWLRADLAAHPARCTLAFWHHPRFSSGEHGNHDALAPLWRALHDAGADVIVQAHDHIYERFAPLAPDGRPDPAHGVRSFVVGTGGAELYPFRDQPAAGSEVRHNGTLGILELTLHPDRYDWEFVPVDGAEGVDRGSDRCHGGATSS
jgi:hypothetical protein